MDNQHSDVAAELWSLAETVLTRLEPLLRQAVQEQSERPRQGCSWCPVCALAALLRGEQHDLLTLVTSEGASVRSSLSMWTRRVSRPQRRARIGPMAQLVPKSRLLHASRRSR